MFISVKVSTDLCVVCVSECRCGGGGEGGGVMCVNNQQKWGHDGHLAASPVPVHSLIHVHACA